MKGNKRAIYLILAREVNYAICSFCKFGSFSGSPCCDGEYECDHPLSYKMSMETNIENAQELGDCWAFRPTYSVEIAADIVGIILEQGFGTTTWITQGDQLIIRGIKGES